MKKLEHEFGIYEADYLDEVNDKIFLVLSDLSSLYNDNENFKQKDELFQVINCLEEIRSLLFQLRNNYYKSSC